MKRIFTVAALGVLSIFGYSQQPDIEINEDLRALVLELEDQFDMISEERKQTLSDMAQMLVESNDSGEAMRALFICTHNSRRSHLSDLWYKFGVMYYGLSGFESYSGGTEATRFHPNAIAAIQRAGFRVQYRESVENPVVQVTPGGTFPIWRMSSKTYGDESNPQSNFMAVMVCSDADQSCPIVDGASARFGLPFNDPKHFDGTPSQDDKYDATLQLIGREVLFLTHEVKMQTALRIESEQN